MPSLHVAFLTTIVLLADHTSASTCRNLTNTRWGSDIGSQFSTNNLVTLEKVSCPPNSTQPSSALPKCSVPRNIYDITVPRLINVTVSPEDEDAIFERARLSYWEGSSQRDNMSAWDKEWVSLPRRVDTNRGGREGDTNLFFETSASTNYTLSFLSYNRWVVGTLGGCDNETLNGMGINVQAPYEMRDSNNVSIVVGQLQGSAINTTRANDNKNAASRMDILYGGLYTITGLVGLMMYL